MISPHRQRGIRADQMSLMMGEEVAPGVQGPPVLLGFQITQGKVLFYGALGKLLQNFTKEFGYPSRCYQSFSRKRQITHL